MCVCFVCVAFTAKYKGNTEREREKYTCHVKHRDYEYSCFDKHPQHFPLQDIFMSFRDRIAKHVNMNCPLFYSTVRKSHLFGITVWFKITQKSSLWKLLSLYNSSGSTQRLVTMTI